MRSLIQGFELKPVFRTYSRFDEDVANNAISFILSRDNVKFISWGTKNVNGVEFPKLIRTRAPEHIYKAYESAFPEKSSQLSYSAFLKVVGAVTSSDGKVCLTWNTSCILSTSF